MQQDSEGGSPGRYLGGGYAGKLSNVPTCYWRFVNNMHEIACTVAIEKLGFLATGIPCCSSTKLGPNHWRDRRSRFSLSLYWLIYAKICLFHLIRPRRSYISQLRLIRSGISSCWKYSRRGPRSRDMQKAGKDQLGRTGVDARITNGAERTAKVKDWVREH